MKKVELGVVIEKQKSSIALIDLFNCIEFNHLNWTSKIRDSGLGIILEWERFA